MTTPMEPIDNNDRFYQVLESNVGDYSICSSEKPLPNGWRVDQQANSCQQGWVLVQQLSQPGPDAKPAEQAIIQAFQKHDLVGLAEVHWHPQVMAFFIQLIKTPGFADQVNDLVVEFGNSQHQSLVDRYIRGESIELEQVQQAWRNSLNFMVWMPEVYQAFFQAVRSVNQALPPAKQLRIVLAEAPFSWQDIKDKADWQALLRQREYDYLQRIETEVLAKQRKALMIFGAYHFTRQPAPDFPLEAPPLGQLLAQRYPGNALLVWALDEQHFPYPSKLNNWPMPALATVAGSWLETLNFKDIEFRLRRSSGSANQSFVSVGEMVDAVLYLGKLKRVMKVHPRMLADADWIAEMKRRASILGEPHLTRINNLLKQQN